MHRGSRVLYLLPCGILFTCQILLAQRGVVRSGAPTGGSGYVPTPSAYSVQTPSFPSFPGFPQFSAYGFTELRAPTVDSSWTAPSYPPAPAVNYWWVGSNSAGDARADGYYPNAGYEWTSVGALVLTTSPMKAQVTLDGTSVGTADKLGPFQLPVGQYTLRVEAAGYQPSVMVVKFDEPGVRELDVKLKPLTAVASAAARN